MPKGYFWKVECLACGAWTTSIKSECEAWTKTHNLNCQGVKQYTAPVDEEQND